MLVVLTGMALAAAPANPWNPTPYFRPTGALSLYTSGGETSTVYAIGAEVGLRYARTFPELPNWGGRTRAVGTFAFLSEDVESHDVRLGTFFGPRWSLPRIEGGLDVFHNQLLVGGAGLEPTLGFALPVIGTLDLEILAIFGGVEPALVTNAARQVDWSDQEVFGFGHEFTYIAGAYIDIDGLRLSGTWRYQIVAVGEQQSLSVGLHI